MALPPQFLDDLRSRLSLSDVVMKRMRLIRAGREFKAPCPFHNEKTPSFYVNDDKGFFHCLAGETGVLLREGVRPIAELAGTTQTVLTRGGRWVEARFAAYGVQKLLRLTLTRNGLTKVVHATDGHRWFVRGATRAVLTRHLEADQALESVYSEDDKSRSLDEHQGSWVVQSVEETDREEEVYCAEVPGDHAFALEDNILTGNCFGCGAHGDHIAFLMRHGNLSFVEAVEQLAAEAGMQVPKASPEARQKYEKQKSLYDLVERAAKYFEEQLHQPAGRKALEYLRRRGLDDAAIGRFRLGYAPSEGGGLHAVLTEAGYAEADMIEAGLFKRPETGRSARAFFWNRVMFPVTDRRGRVVAFGGRIMEGEGPKYINSSENPLFHKGQVLYGMARARQAAADGHTLIVTEGYMDVISCVLAGFEGAVAPLGTAMTETQILELWKLAPEGRRTPVLCFDGDNAGRRAAQRAVERILPLLMPDHSACVAFLPEKEDPDSLIRTGGRGAFQAVLERAKPLAEVLWETESLGRNLALPDDRAGLEAALLERCQQIADPRVRRAYEQDMRDRLFKLSRDNRPKGKGKGAGGGRWGAPAEQPGQRHWDPRHRSGLIHLDPRRREHLVLQIIVNHPALFDEFGEQLADVTFTQAEVESLRREVVAALASDSSLDSAALRLHLSQRGHAETLDSLLNADAPYAQPGASLEAARSGWLDIWASSEELVLQADIKEAERAFARDPTPETMQRLFGLKEEQLRRKGHSFELSSGV